MDFQLTSPAFANNEAIPDKYTCHGEDISPPLAISGVPPGTVSLALILHDPDAPSGDFLHWTVWNIPASTTELPENRVVAGAVEGLTDFAAVGYGGPCPPSGTHRYFFELYALDAVLDFPAGTNRQTLVAAINNHLLDSCDLVGVTSA